MTNVKVKAVSCGLMDASTWVNGKMASSTELVFTLAKKVNREEESGKWARRFLGLMKRMVKKNGFNKKS